MERSSLGRGKRIHEPVLLYLDCNCLVENWNRDCAIHHEERLATVAAFKDDESVTV